MPRRTWGGQVIGLEGLKGSRGPVGSLGGATFDGVLLFVRQSKRSRFFLPTDIKGSTRGLRGPKKVADYESSNISHCQ